MMTLSLADTLDSIHTPITMEETERQNLLEYLKRTNDEGFVKSLPVKLVDVRDPETGLRQKTLVSYYSFVERPEIWITGALLLGIGALGFFVGRRTR